MNYLLLFLSTFAAAAKGIMCKKIGHDTGDKRRMFLFNSVIFLFASSVIFCSLIARISDIFRISAYSFVLALLFAFFLLFTQTTEILAMRFGSVSMTMLIYSCGFLIPIFYGRIFLGEPISPMQLAGLFVLLLALVLIISPRKNERFSFPWLIFTALATLSSGTSAVIQKIHQSSVYKDELLPFLFFALLFSSLFSLIAVFFTRGGSYDVGEVKNGKIKTLIFLILGGLCVGLLNILNLRLAGKLPAVIQFPIYSIGSMILTGLCGRFVYKEILSRRKLVGFAVGCVAITVIALL